MVPPAYKNSGDIVLFDMDGTLTHARQKIDWQTVVALRELSRHCLIGVVSGSPYGYIDQQIKMLWSDVGSCKPSDVILLPCNGTQLLVFDIVTGYYQIEYEIDMKQHMCDKLGEKAYQELINHILELQIKFLSLHKFPALTGNFVSYRKSMVNWSPVGRDAKTDERNAFMKLDLEETIRESLCEALRVRLDASGLHEIEFNLGGATSIDIHPTGWDKTHALNHFGDRRVWFVGDKCEPGGNDHSLWAQLSPAGRGFTTTGPEETERLVREVILPGVERGHHE